MAAWTQDELLGLAERPEWEGPAAYTDPNVLLRTGGPVSPYIPCHYSPFKQAAYALMHNAVVVVDAM